MHSAPAPLPRDAVERVYRLSPLQAGMLFHELMTPDASPYFRQTSFDLAGAVDAACCEAAWNGLLVRHPLLRSVFDFERTAQPLQIVLTTQTVEFHAEDVEGPDAAAHVERWRRQDVDRGFDLRRDRLIRVALFRHAPDRFEMIWSHPHILLDGWSGAILAEEFALLYADACRGIAPGVAPAADPDAYMAAVAARDDAAALRHWVALLDGYDELATLPRRPHGAAPGRNADHRFRIGEAETAALLKLASTSGATLGVLLQALWGLLLGRWTGRQDVVFGIVTSGRSVATPGIDRLVGMFINTIPVRVRWDAGESLDELLRRLQRQADAAVAYEHCGLAEIQAASALPSGLLDHLLVLENFPEGRIDAAATGFRVTRTVVDERANYDFGIIIHAGNGLDINLQHDASRIAPGQMARLEQHWRTLVAAVLASPQGLLSGLDCMPENERRQLDADALGPLVARDEDATLVTLWHAQADLAPDAPALAADGVRLSYRALDQAAEGVGSRLRAAGVGPGAVVGVLCGRTANRVIALLGILKAGGIYLPLSPALPDQRIAMMLDDSGCSRVLADGDGLARLETLRPGLAMAIAGAPSADRQPCCAAATDVAYIIYTSGSTGRPKGVAVEHRGFVNMILAQIHDFGVRPDDCVVQFASCSFDASLSEIFMALLSGARLMIAPDDAIRDGAKLLALIAAEGVTVATLPPSYLRALEGAELGSVRILITAGEAPDPNDAVHYGKRLHAFNAYGPTEASVCASWHRVDPDNPYPRGIPIGRPIANTGMTVRDRQGRPMPLGTVGEICLSGRGLARGYLGQPALTAERFPVVDGERVYRTGDAGLTQDDGAVLYLGRLDGQVKLNGHRIELGEIEQRLRGHAAVSQAAVVVADDPQRLLAFIVPQAPVDTEALRRDLLQTLPPWMVPAAILTLAALPKTIAGKVDRRALAAMQRARPPDASRSIAAEALVAGAFTAVLGSGAFGRHNSFAAAGGDSLRAIRLLGRLRRDGFALDLKDMLAADTVAAIARAGLRAGAGDDRPVTGPVPLTPIQRWFFAVDPEGEAQLNHLVLLRALRSPLDGPALATALQAIWRRHDALRLRFRPGDDGWTADCAAPDAGFALRTVDCRNIADPWPLIAADAAANQPAAAGGTGPLFLATHYRLREADHLLLAAHHLLVDAVSWRIIIEDIGDALRQLAAGQSVCLAGKTSSYRDWALAVVGDGGLDLAERQRPYWEAVAGAPVTRPAAVPVHGYGSSELLTADLGAVEPGVSDRRVLARLLARLGRLCEPRTAARRCTSSCRAMVGTR